MVFTGALAAVWYSGCFSTTQPPESPHDDDNQLAGSEEDIPKFTNKRTKSVSNGIGMKLVLVPAGEFMMGNNHSVADEISLIKKYNETSTERRFQFEYPPHSVHISRPFWMGAHHITRAQFGKFVADTGYKTDAEKGEEPGVIGIDLEKKTGFRPNGSWRNVGFPQADDHPVVNVSWNDAKAFCDWLSKREGECYRLPTEAEWEYACRAGTATRFWCGDNPETLAKVANIADAEFKKKFSHWLGRNLMIRASDGYTFTSPVGSFPPNPFGLYDMHGNASQWCEHKWRIYDGARKVDPIGELTDRHGLRGGSWRLVWVETRCAARITLVSASLALDDFSFRVVREHRDGKAKQPGKSQ